MGPEERVRAEGAAIADARQVAAHLAVGILGAGENALTEEDLRIGVERLLGPALEELGVDARPRYERSYQAVGSILRGRSDAVYGRVVIEYERPGKLSRQPGIHEAAHQLAQYLRSEAQGDEESLRRSVGVALDGQKIMFVRYLNRAEPPSLHFPLQETLPLFPEEESSSPAPSLIPPTPVTEDSIRTFLIYLRALRRRRLSPEALAEEFGPTGDIARSLVGPLAEALREGSHPRTRMLFREWSRIFGIVYGKEFGKESRDSAVLSELYGLPKRVRLKRLLFAVHTYYALLMKLLAAELASLQSGALLTSTVASLPSLTSSALKQELMDLEDGGLFGRLGIRNYLEGDYFGWYLAAWSPAIEAGIREMARRLDEFEPATESLEPESTRDLLKRLYQYLVPRQLRHDLGEFYTPDWLAELLLDEVEYDGDPAVRVVDPACGSGTFLVLAIRRARERAERGFDEPRDTVDAILRNIVGFDINPLAVIAARTNYLLALGSLVRHRTPLEIPIYLCDSVLGPFQHRQSQESLLPDYSIASSVGAFFVPKSVVDGNRLPDLVEALEHGVRHRYSESEFMAQLEPGISALESIDSLPRLFRRIAKLESEERNGLWARIIKNGFAPVSHGQFDLVVGNPPWIRWGYLADEYRTATKQMWLDYGLFSLTGMAARLGGGEKDFAMLFTYASADFYLKPGGKLAFVITQEVLKGKGAGEGFRQFKLGPDGEDLKVLKAHDLVTVAPFEGAGNKSAAIVLSKGAPTTFPVPYVVWGRREGVGSLGQGITLAEASQLTHRSELEALPLSDEPGSAWQTYAAGEAENLSRLKGTSSYRARIGARLEPYGVFWLRILGVRADGLLLVENLPEYGKTSIERVEGVVEPDLVYPLLRGADIARWRALPTVLGLVTQDPVARVGFAESRMRVEWPRTYGYLRTFEALLRERAAFKKYYEPADPFYSQFNISAETFAPYRVVWKRMAGDITAAVVGTTETRFGERLMIPLDTTSFVPVNDADEAHYLCGVLNSAPVRAFIKSFSSAGRGFGTPSILRHTAIPRFDRTDRRHMEIAGMARQAADAHRTSLSKLHEAERRISELALELWLSD